MKFAGIILIALPANLIATLMNFCFCFHHKVSRDKSHASRQLHHVPVTL